MTEQIKLWGNEFGTEYAERNALTEEFLRPRYLFWDNMLKNLYYAFKELPKDILEIGAGSGANLMSIRQVYRQARQPINEDGDIDPQEAHVIPHNLFATEVNADAAQAMQYNVPGVKLLPYDKLHQFPNIADLAFTSGVLIHTHPAQRLELMRNIYNASRRFIVCIEYFAPETRMIPYRGQDNALWLDDYGSLWLDNFNVRVANYGFCWKKVTGLDNVTYWIFEKIN